MTNSENEKIMTIKQPKQEKVTEVYLNHKDVLEQALNAIRENDKKESENSNKTDLLVEFSADMRENETQIKSVDINLFPGGHNNLTDESIELAKKNTAELFKEKDIKKLIIIIENAGTISTNPKYYENVQKLYEICSSALNKDGKKIQVKIQTIGEPKIIADPEKISLELFPNLASLSSKEKKVADDLREKCKNSYRKVQEIFENLCVEGKISYLDNITEYNPNDKAGEYAVLPNFDGTYGDQKILSNEHQVIFQAIDLGTGWSVRSKEFNFAEQKDIIRKLEIEGVNILKDSNKSQEEIDEFRNDFNKIIKPAIKLRYAVADVESSTSKHSKVDYTNLNDFKDALKLVADEEKEIKKDITELKSSGGNVEKIAKLELSLKSVKAKKKKQNQKITLEQQSIKKKTILIKNTVENSVDQMWKGVEKVLNQMIKDKLCVDKDFLSKKDQSLKNSLPTYIKVANGTFGAGVVPFSFNINDDGAINDQGKVNPDWLQRTLKNELAKERKGYMTHRILFGNRDGKIIDECSVIVQEGIPTEVEVDIFDSNGEKDNSNERVIAEVAGVNIGGKTVGGYCRYSDSNMSKSTVNDGVEKNLINLNRQGQSFLPVSFNDLTEMEKFVMKLLAISTNREMIHSTKEGYKDRLDSLGKEKINDRKLVNDRTWCEKVTAPTEQDKEVASTSIAP